MGKDDNNKPHTPSTFARFLTSPGVRLATSSMSAGKNVPGP